MAPLDGREGVPEVFYVVIVVWFLGWHIGTLVPTKKPVLAIELKVTFNYPTPKKCNPGMFGHRHLKVYHRHLKVCPLNHRNMICKGCWLGTSASQPGLQSLAETTDNAPPSPIEVEPPLF